jgi:transcriptional regulator with GAF, ATPase, and Fis domain
MDDVLLRMVAACRDFIGGDGEAGDVLTKIAELGTTALNADMAGLTLNDADGGPKTAVFTNGMVPEIDQAQYDAGRGPCLDAARDGTPRRVSGSSMDWERWPEFLHAATSHGINSTLSLPVVVAKRPIGALNFYAERPDHFDDTLAQVADGFAAQAAIVAAYCDKADLAEHLQKAMESRAAIEQAKGVIMATMGIGPDAAFTVLREQSQQENRKLRDIAVELVARQVRNTPH